jgi:aminoglycoside 2'-N-acetyltransferase I
MSAPLVASTDELTRNEIEQIRQLLDDAFGGTFSDDDWNHSIGGLHVFVRLEGKVVSHGSVVARRLDAGTHRLSTGYVEAVATRADVRGRGHARRVLRRLAEQIETDFELGALSADVPQLYAALGWETWRGPTYVHAPGGRRRTVGDDGAVMVLRTSRTATVDLDLDLTCDWRVGDVW